LAVDHLRAALGCSERRACKTIGQHRSTQRKPKVKLVDKLIDSDNALVVQKIKNKIGQRDKSASLLGD